MGLGLKGLGMAGFEGEDFSWNRLLGIMDFGASGPKSSHSGAIRVDPNIVEKSRP